MLEKPIAVKESKNKKYRYVINDKKDGHYEILIQTVIEGENMEEKWIQYCDIKGYAYITNNLETARKIAEDTLADLK